MGLLPPALAPAAASMRGEAPELGGAADLLSLLLAHAPSIMAVFSGHYHRRVA